MKKFIFGLLSVAIASSFLAACDDDAEDGIKHDTAPAKTCAGVYNGQWIIEMVDVTNSGDTTAKSTKNSDGTITLVDSSAYVIGLDLNSESTEAEFTAIKVQTSANITTLRDKDYCFNNRSESNKLGLAFYGEIKQQELNMYFSKSAKQGRTATRYTNYHFVGNK